IDCVASSGVARKERKVAAREAPPGNVHLPGMHCKGHAGGPFPRGGGGPTGHTIDTISACALLGGKCARLVRCCRVSLSHHPTPTRDAFLPPPTLTSERPFGHALSPPNASRADTR